MSFRFAAGDYAVFSEDGHDALVFILTAYRTAERERYRFRVVRALRRPSAVLAPGEEYDVEQVRHAVFPGMWRLLPLDEYKLHWPKANLALPS